MGEVVKTHGLNISPITLPIPYDIYGTAVDSYVSHRYTFKNNTGRYTSIAVDNLCVCHISASNSEDEYLIDSGTGAIFGTFKLNNVYTYKGKTVYYSYLIGSPFHYTPTIYPACNNGAQLSRSLITNELIQKICWLMMYSDDYFEEDLEYIIESAYKTGYYYDNGAKIEQYIYKVLIKEEETLRILPSEIGPGSVAHTAGMKNAWQMDFDRKWIPVFDEDE